MAAPEFPPRQYTLNKEPLPGKSIDHSSGFRKLFKALKKGLNEDEWEEIKASSIGVFLKFYELQFGWASRLVHFMLSFQLVCHKKYELWSLIGRQPIRFSLLEFQQITGLNCDYIKNLEYPELEDDEEEVSDECTEFWQLLGVPVQVGPSIVDLIDACGRCQTWTREERLRLGYLAIYCGYIEAQPRKTPTRVNLARLVMDTDVFLNYPWGRVAFKNLMDSVKQKDIRKTYTIDGFAQVLQSWVYFALPDFANAFGEPLPNNPTPLLLAYKGSRGRKGVRKSMTKEGSRINFGVLKPYSQMFPKWDNDVEDEKVVNIVKAICGQFGDGKRVWQWEMSHWPATGVKPSTIPKKGSKGGVENEHNSDEESEIKRIEAPPLADEGLLASIKTELKAEMVAGFQKMHESFSISFIDMGVKVDHLAKLVVDLKDEVARMRSGAPPVVSPAVPPGKVADPTPMEVDNNLTADVDQVTQGTLSKPPSTDGVSTTTTSLKTDHHNDKYVEENDDENDEGRGEKKVAENEKKKGAAKNIIKLKRSSRIKDKEAKKVKP